MLRLGRSGQPADIGRWANLLLETLREPDGLRALETVLRYLTHVRDDDDDFIDVLVRATDDEEVEAIAMSYRDRVFNQGREEGRVAELEAWSERMLTAETMDAVFEG